VIALNPQTGEEKWKLGQFDASDSAMLKTPSDLLFTGLRGFSHSVTLIMKAEKYVSVISDHTLATSGLRD
jgi:hypothetical protein